MYPQPWHLKRTWRSPVSASREYQPFIRSPQCAGGVRCRRGAGGVSGRPARYQELEGDVIGLPVRLVTAPAAEAAHTIAVEGAVLAVGCSLLLLPNGNHPVKQAMRLELERDNRRLEC